MKKIVVNLLVLQFASQIAICSQTFMCSNLEKFHLLSSDNQHTGVAITSNFVEMFNAGSLTFQVSPFQSSDSPATLNLFSTGIFGSQSTSFLCFINGNESGKFQAYINNKKAGEPFYLPPNTYNSYINIVIRPPYKVEVPAPSKSVPLGIGQSVVVLDDESITLTNLLTALKQEANVKIKSDLTLLYISPVFSTTPNTYSKLLLPASELTQLNAALTQNLIVNVSSNLAQTSTGQNLTMTVSLPVVNEPIFSYTFTNILNIQKTPVLPAAKLFDVNFSYQTKDMSAVKASGTNNGSFSIARS